MLRTLSPVAADSAPIVSVASESEVLTPSLLIMDGRVGQPERRRAYDHRVGIDEPVAIRDAATVVLLRDGERGVEVYLQRRAAGMVFAAGVHVFPGGAMDAGDDDLVHTAAREVEEETGLVLDRARIRPWARWVTPEGEPRRYDTRFYVAGVAADARPVGVGTEMDTVDWWTPSGALAARDRGEIVLWPPTLVTLTEVGGFPTVADVLTAAADRDLEPVLPTLIRDPDGYRVVLPDGRELRR